MAPKKSRYSAKQKYQSRKAPSTKSIMYKRPTARTQQYQIARLSRAVQLNERRIRAQRYLVQHNMKWEAQEFNQPSGYAPYMAWGLSKPPFMNQIFGDPEEAKGGKYTGKTMRIDFQISVGKSTKVTNFTAFVVRPKSQKVINEVGLSISDTRISPSSTDPNPLVSGVDYSYEGGIALMNPKRWHIDKMWKMQVRPDVGPFYSTGTPQTVTNLTHNANMVRRSYTCKNRMKINNRTGVWSDVSAQQLATSQRAYLIIFNDAVATPAGTPGPGPKFEGMVHYTAHTSE